MGNWDTWPCEPSKLRISIPEEQQKAGHFVAKLQMEEWIGMEKPPKIKNFNFTLKFVKILIILAIPTNWTWADLTLIMDETYYKNLNSSNFFNFTITVNDTTHPNNTNRQVCVTFHFWI